MTAEKTDFSDALVRLRELSGEWGQDMFSYIASAVDKVGTGTMNLINGFGKGLDIAFGNAASKWLGSDSSAPTAHAMAGADTTPAVTAPAAMPAQAAGPAPLTQMPDVSGIFPPEGMVTAMAAKSDGYVIEDWNNGRLGAVQLPTTPGGGRAAGAGMSAPPPAA